MLKTRRIAILLPCLLTGGTEVVTLDTARVFLGMGFAVDVIVYFDEIDPGMLEAARAAGAAVVQLGVHREGGRLTNARLALALFKQLLAGRYELIWLQYMTPTLLPLLLAKHFTRRLVACVHVEANHYTESGIRRLRWLARHWCNHVVCVSHTVANGIFGGDWRKSVYRRSVVVIPNSLNMEEAQASTTRDWRQELDIGPDYVVIGYCGRLARIKGADILVSAFAQLLEKGYRAKLVIAGAGEERHKLADLGDSLSMGDSLYFVGQLSREAVFSALKGFDIAVVPSREEGFGLSAIEAMAVGTPLVASDVGALSEVVIDNETGLLFSNGSTEELAARLVDLLEQPDLRHRLATTAKSHVAERYGMSGYQRHIAELVAVG